MLHIYRSPGQLLTKPQRCPWIGRGIKFSPIPGNRLVWARCCEEMRPAKNCYVQHYYDCSYVWCIEGKGCKKPRHTIVSGDQCPICRPRLRYRRAENP